MFPFMSVLFLHVQFIPLKLIGCNFDRKMQKDVHPSKLTYIDTKNDDL